MSTVVGIIDIVLGAIAVNWALRILRDPMTWIGVRWYTIRHRNHVAGSIETHAPDRHLIEIVYRGRARREWVEMTRDEALAHMTEQVRKLTGVGNG